MRAVSIRQGAIEIEEHPDPLPGSGEVLVRVRAAGLNGADMMQRAGRYPAPAGSPQDIPGLELAGEVAALGPGASRFAVGERVMAIVGGGGQAELALVHERQLMPVPEALSWTEAGGLPEVFLTAHDALFAQAQLRPGERLLVHGGAGGVGTAAIQLGALTGARVLATVRDPSLRPAVAQLGAQVIAPEGFGEHGPFDVILELVGAPNIAENLSALRGGGRIVVIGVGAGAKAEVSLLALMAARGRWRRRRWQAGAWSVRCCRPSTKGACGYRSRRPTRCSALQRHTSALRKGASSARSCLSYERLSADALNTAAAPPASRRARGRHPRSAAWPSARPGTHRCSGQTARRSSASAPERGPGSRQGRG